MSLKECSKLLKNPIECENYHENFCQEHTNTFYNCHLCNEPFIGTINNGLSFLSYN